MFVGAIVSVVNRSHARRAAFASPAPTNPAGVAYGGMPAQNHGAAPGAGAAYQQPAVPYSAQPQNPAGGTPNTMRPMPLPPQHQSAQPADSADIHTESAEFFYAARRRLAQRRDSSNYGSATGRTGISWCLQQRCERGGGSWNIVRIAVPHMTRAVGSASSAALRGNPPLERRVLLRYRPLRYPCRAMATWRRSHRFHCLREHPRRHPTMVLPHSQRMRAMPAHLRPSPPETPPRHRPIPPDPPPRSRPPSAHA